MIPSAAARGIGFVEFLDFRYSCTRALYSGCSVRAPPQAPCMAEVLFSSFRVVQTNGTADALIFTVPDYQYPLNFPLELSVPTTVA